jgi:hypothetical protein
VGEAISPLDKQRLEDTAAYLVRNPLSLEKLVYLDGHRAVLYRSRMNPSLGRNFEALDPLSNRARGVRRPPGADPGEQPTEVPRRRSSPSWARLIAKIYQVDPLVCSRCGQKMQMIAFLTDPLSIGRILDHLFSG